MVGIYLTVACLAVVIVALFVDNLPGDLVDNTADIRNQVSRNIIIIIIIIIIIKSFITR